MIRIDDVRLGEDPPRDIHVVVTHPAGSPPMALAVDPTHGLLRIERLYQTAMRTPGTFGLIPRTRGQNGNPLSAFIPIDDPIAAGMVVACRPAGVIYVTGAERDVETVLAVPLREVTPRFDRVRAYTDVPSPQLRQLAHFLSHYQDLEDDQVPRAVAWGDVNEAHRVIEEAAHRASPRLPLAD